MRKISTLFVLLFVIAVTSSAQGKKRTGFRAGANYAFQRIEEARETESSDHRIGLSIGLFQEIPLTNFISFQPELSYNRLGGKFNETLTKLDYISLPLLFKVHGKHFGVYAGPQFSLLINAKEKPQYTSEISVKDNYKSVDAAAVLGTEYSFLANRLVISLRYMLGMTEAIKNTGAGNSVRNHGIQLTAGVRF